MNITNMIHAKKIIKSDILNGQFFRIWKTKWWVIHFIFATVAIWIVLFTIQLSKMKSNGTLRKKCMQQNLFCCPDKTFLCLDQTFCCPDQTFCLSNQNLIDIAKYFVGTKKQFCCININKIFLFIWQNYFLSVNSAIKVVTYSYFFCVYIWKYCWI